MQTATKRGGLRMMLTMLANSLPKVNRNLMHHTYILECADKTLYVGCTNNLEKRLLEHNHRKNGAHYTKIRRPVALIYHETFATLKQARSREAEIKRMSREEKLKMVGKKQI